MYEIKTEHVYEDFSSNKEIFDFSNYSTKSKYYDSSNRLIIGKMRDETRSVTIEEFVGLKPKMYSFLVDNNENVYINNNKCIRHSVNRIQSKDHRIETYEINKISLSCFDDKIYVKNNGYDGLALGY